MHKLKFIWLILLLWGCSLQMMADDKVSFTAEATPNAVAVGDQIRLSYTVTTQKVKDFRIPSLKGFDVLAGPNASRNNSIQIINGHTTSTNTITYTYILLAKDEGTFTIPGATIVAQGNQLISNSVRITVLPADSSNGLSQNGSASGSVSRASSQEGISGTDLFITATTSKTSMFEQEAVLLTYKIYSLVDLRGFDNVKLPDFKGFHSQEVELPTDRRWGLEHYKGRNYRTTVYRQFVLFPQQTGKISIDAAYFDASVVQLVHTSDPFEAFFNGGSNYAEIKKTLTTPKLTVNVKSLPSGKPNNFSGGVGEFKITSNINATEVKANEAITLKLIINGVGNLKLLSTPEVKFPEEFETYDPKVNNDSRLTSQGLSGSKTIEYLAIPRTEGTYRIPAVTFSYFDVKSQSYKSLLTESYEIKVAKGSGGTTSTAVNYSNKEELKVLNEDIRFIKQTPAQLMTRGNYLFGSWKYTLYYILPLIVFLLFVFFYRKQMLTNKNTARIRTKKANKVAVKRLKNAGRMLKNNQREAFYDEVLKALWGYISDKLNIPLSQLTKDNIEEKLIMHHVDNTLIKEFINVLNNCEFARFAPGDANATMDTVFNSSVDVISQMENSIKH